MDIPYTVRTRPDTGLYNGKLGMWLFLSSEVMLFGGLFAAYVFLRLHSAVWPHGMLDVPIGFANTMILILSSITMIVAWASLKLRKFDQFRGFLMVTILLGIAFLGIKSTEYYKKIFVHYGVFIRANAFDKYKTDLEEQHAKVTYHPDSNLYEVTGDIQDIVATKKSGDVLLEEIEKAPGHRHDAKAPPETAAMSDQIRVIPGVSVAAAKATTALTGEEGILFKKEDIARSGFFWPKYSTYFAIYFAMTGLHVLHILGGIIVMAWFFCFSYKMYGKEPEHLTNRIECTGLFWHFVDLVWIFLFPVLYLF